jgi:Mg/Co/Ni transporter MgtE
MPRAVAPAGSGIQHTAAQLKPLTVLFPIMMSIGGAAGGVESIERFVIEQLAAGVA